MIEIETKYGIEGVKNYLYTREELESLSTERLVLFMRHHCEYRHDEHMMSPDYYHNLHKGIIEVDADWGSENTLKAYYWAIEEELREILKTRPNIPNKEQRKKKRIYTISQNKKKTKRNLKYKRY